MKECKGCGNEFLGYKNSQYCNNKCSSTYNNGMKGKKFPEEAKQKIRNLWKDPNSIFNSKEYRTIIKCGHR